MREKYHFVWKGKIIYVLSFVIPLLLFVIYMAVKGIEPFGDATLLFYDGQGQSYPWFLEFYRKLHAGDSLWFSWNMGAGTDFYMTACPILLSPVNWFLLLVPETALAAAFGASLLLRCAFASVAMTFYFMHSDAIKQKEYKRPLSLLAGMGYGLSASVLSYFYILSWPEVYICFPLLLYALELLIKRRQKLLYYLLLTYLLLLNQYMAYMVCIFLVLWYIYQTDAGTFRKRFVAFAGTSVLSAVSAMIVIVPVLYTYMNKSRDISSVTVDLKGVGNIWDMLNRLFPFNSLDSLGQAFTTYNIYCGSILFLMAFYYLFFSKFKDASGAKLKALLLFMGASLCVYFLMYVWHVFAFAHNLNNRFAFIFTFVLIYAGCKGVLALLACDMRHTVLFFAAAMLLYTGIVLLNSEPSGPEVYIVVILLWVFILLFALLLKRQSITSKTYIKLLVVLGVLELAASTEFSLLKNNVSKWMKEDAYVYGRQAFAEWDTKAERIGYTEIGCANAGALFGVQTGALFSSTIDKDVLALYKHLGLAAFDNGLSYYYRGSTPFTDLLLNVGGAVTENDREYSGEIIKHIGPYSLMDSSANVGYGFMIYGEESTDADFAETDVFENQNVCFSAMGGERELFTKADMSTLSYTAACALTEQTDENTIRYVNACVLKEDGSVFKIEDFDEAKRQEGMPVILSMQMDISYMVPEDMDLYIYMHYGLQGAIAAYVDGETIQRLYVTGNTEMLHIGNVKQGQKVLIQYTNGTTTAEID
ncbi:MAG: YfhO family protein, partial [Lachnospiraceae bacterium]|nr:YfhO family protein [Lachnospiraceae bacterium]